MSTWTEPPTWVADDYVTAAQFNILGRNLELLHDRERVHCYNSQDEELRDSQWECLRWDSEHMDNNSMHSNHRIKRNRRNRGDKHGDRDGNWPATSELKSARVVVNNGGAYMAILKVNFEANSTGSRRIQLRVNSSESQGGGKNLGTWIEDAVSSGQTSMFCKRFVMLDRGDHLNAFAWQSSGDKLDVIAGDAVTFFQVFQLSN